MAIIARIERIRTDQIDSVGGQEVLQYRGVSLPLLCLENYIQAQPRPATKKIYVVVFTVHGREIGLIVPSLTDIREVPTNVDTITFSEPGVIGSVEVGGQAMRLLDLYRLAQAAHPDLLVESQALESHHVGSTLQDADDRPATTILVAEDSGFFLKQVTGQLKEAGYEVIGCDNGQIAFDLATAAITEHRPFDVILMDMQMPVMDGYEATRRLRDDGYSCPIIALTAHAMSTDRLKCLDAGCDDYTTKPINRTQLIELVASHAKQVTEQAAEK